MANDKVLKATIKLVDNFTRPMERAIRQTEQLGNRYRKLAKIMGKPINFLFKVDSKIYNHMSKMKAQYDRLKSTFKQYLEVKIKANKVTSLINTIKRQLSALNRLKTVITVKDKVTSTINKIKGKIKTIAGKAHSVAVNVKDKASSILGGIKSKLAMLASGVTIGVAVKQIAGGAMDLQQNQTSIRHFMGVGNAGKDKNALDSMANDYSSWLVNNANLTPFSTAEVMAGGAKALTATGGNVAKAQEMIKRAEDMAGLMGKPLEQAIDALMDIELGQYARLTEFGISAEGGAKGDSPEEVLKEIDRRFAGGAEKLSQSAKGKMSTAMGKISSSLASIGTAFLPIMANMFDNISGLVDSVTPKITAFAGKTAEAFNSFAQSEQANQYMQIFKTVGETVFNAIKAVIEACSPVVESIFTFIGQHSTEISTIIQTLGTIWSSVWKTVGVLLKSAWGICQPILSLLLGALSKVSGAVEAICNAWNKMVNLLKTPINAVVNVAQKGINAVGNALGISSGRNAFGSGRIARDGTLRTLHEGEKVLTKQEANRYEKGTNTGVNITINGLTVREESDINKIASQLLKKINENKIVYGGAY